ncbi:hypothetical protein HK098_005187 [Nowakowskiella sp. JEL0407]|nr:hypothetical protein HK098_005187 [Nowakowskiella sp. JEL0407]
MVHCRWVLTPTGVTNFPVENPYGEGATRYDSGPRRQNSAHQTNPLGEILDDNRGWKLINDSPNRMTIMRQNGRTVLSILRVKNPFECEIMSPTGEFIARVVKRASSSGPNFTLSFGNEPGSSFTMSGAYSSSNRTYQPMPPEPAFSIPMQNYPQRDGRTSFNDEQSQATLRPPPVISPPPLVQFKLINSYQGINLKFSVYEYTSPFEFRAECVLNSPEYHQIAAIPLRMEVLLIAMQAYLQKLGSEEILLAYSLPEKNQPEEVNRLREERNQCAGMFFEFFECCCCCCCSIYTPKEP